MTCPAVLHSHCVGLHDVPSGEWHCPQCLCAACGIAGFGERLDATTGSVRSQCCSQTCDSAPAITCDVPPQFGGAFLDNNKHSIFYAICSCSAVDGLK
jgi:hypothetical protein